MPLENEVHQIHGALPLYVSGEGVRVLTHQGAMEWRINPRNPLLLAGELLPDVVYGDVVQLTVNGLPSHNNRTYVKLEKKTGRLTAGQCSLDPQRP